MCCLMPACGLFRDADTRSSSAVEDDMMDSKEEKAKPEGGYCLISVGAMLACWQAYRDGQLKYRDVRVWFAAHEMVARRCMLAQGRLAAYGIEELTRLVGGVGGEYLRVSVRRLEACGLISWSNSAVKFPKIECDESRDRRLVPVPRRTVRFLAGCKRPAVTATILGHLMRCVYMRKGECSAKGTCKASWIAQTFGVSLRSVKAARKELAEMGWLDVTESDHWHRQRWGGTAVVNLAWSGLRKQKRQSESAPRPGLSTTESAPPDIKQETPSESRYQNLTSPERPGVKREGEEKPSIRNIKPEDLLRFSRTEELYRQAVAAGWVKHSESQALNWIGAAVRAKTVAGDPVRVFAGIVRKNLWRYVTQEQEDHARRALSRYREHRPEAFRVAG
jgi:hypothetical protein